MSEPGPPVAAPSDPAGGGPAGRAETALLRAVLHILFAVWGLSVREVAPILGGVPLRTLFHWREQPEAAHVDIALRQRLSALLALHKALRRACRDGSGQREWLQVPDADGRTPLAQLMECRTGDIRRLRDGVHNETIGKNGAAASPD